MRKYEFKPDPSGRSWIDKLYITRKQRSSLLKWVFYSAVCIFCLVVQDVIFSKARPFGGTVDLLVAALMVICLLEEIQTGGTYVLIFALVYQFSGSAPGHYVIALLTIYGVLAANFCRSYLQEGFGAVLVCAVGAIFLYEMSVYGIALVQGHAILAAFFRNVMTVVNTAIAVPLLYPLLRAIGAMGGETWKD